MHRKHRHGICTTTLSHTVDYFYHFTTLFGRQGRFHGSYCITTRPQPSVSGITKRYNRDDILCMSTCYTSGSTGCMSAIMRPPGTTSVRIVKIDVQRLLDSVFKHATAPHPTCRVVRRTILSVYCQAHICAITPLELKRSRSMTSVPTKWLSIMERPGRTKLWRYASRLKRVHAASQCT